MGKWHGKHYKGASRDVKAEKRAEAEHRNTLAPPERRASHVRDALMTELTILKRADRNRARRGKKPSWNRATPETLGLTALDVLTLPGNA